MARVGVFETPPRKWFPYDTDTEVELEFISKDRMNKIVNKADAAAKKLGSPQTLIYDMFLGKAAVHGWRHVDQEKQPNHPGLLLPNGNPLSFSDENRNMLMKGCAEFSGFVFRTCTGSAQFLDDALVVDDQKTIDDLIAEADLEEEGGPKND
jgi:hypothetical protein